MSKPFFSEDANRMADVSDSLGSGGGEPDPHWQTAAVAARADAETDRTERRFAAAMKRADADDKRRLG